MRDTQKARVKQCAYKLPICTYKCQIHIIAPEEWIKKLWAECGTHLFLRTVTVRAALK